MSSPSRPVRFYRPLKLERLPATAASPARQSACLPPPLHSNTVNKRTHSSSDATETIDDDDDDGGDTGQSFPPPPSKRHSDNATPKTTVTCYGCLIGHLSQVQHTGPGGCLSHENTDDIAE